MHTFTWHCSDLLGPNLRDGVHFEFAIFWLHTSSQHRGCCHGRDQDHATTRSPRRLLHTQRRHLAAEYYWRPRILCVCQVWSKYKNTKSVVNGVFVGQVSEKCAIRKCVCAREMLQQKWAPTPAISTLHTARHRNFVHVHYICHLRCRHNIWRPIFSKHIFVVFLWLLWIVIKPQ